jgi:hypothetical protein
MPGGAAGPGGPGGPGGAPAAAPVGPVVPPLEGSRTNPFLPPGTEGGAATGGPAKAPFADKYGLNWHQLPITARLGFVRPHIPAHAAVAPPAPGEGPSFDILITSILWTQDGQAMAVYESGPPDNRKSGVVKPGDIVGDWQVAEIWRDRVVVSDRKTGKQQTIYISTKPPAAARPSGGGGRRRPGRRSGQPAGGGMAPPGMPPPVQ